MKIYFVHGFNETGSKWQDAVAQLPDAVNFRYGWRFLVTVWIASKVAAQSLASVARPGDIAVGYSNGCNVVNKAAHYGAKFAHVVYFAPALDRDTKLARQVESATVFHTPNDSVVRVAKFIPFAPWGDMGRVGYQGSDSRYRNVSCPQVAGHMAWRPHVVELMRKYVL